MATTFADPAEPEDYHPWDAQEPWFLDRTLPFLFCPPVTTRATPPDVRDGPQ